MRGAGFKDVWKDRRGYTLPEVLTAVAIAGVLAAISLIIFLALLERWWVEAAADQLAADIRLAHQRHTAADGLARGAHARWQAARGLLQRRLLPRQAEERLRRCRRFARARPRTYPAPRELPEGTRIKEVTFDTDCSGGDPDAAVPPSSCGPEPTRTIEFNSKGTVRTLRPGTSGTVRVSSDDGSPYCGVVFHAATARVGVGPIIYE